MNFKRPIIFDGAFGTSIAYKLECAAPIDFECNEELNLKAPELIKSVHLDFLNAGAQVIETNTFGANRIVLSEHGLANKTREINLAAVKIAKNAIAKKGTGCFLGKKVACPLFVSASIGPTSKLPTLGHISFDELVKAYKEQVGCLLEGGVDILQIETCQDILQAKAAVIGCKEAGSKNIPIMVTMTIEPSGTTLLGTDVGAALATLAPLGIAAFGLNCATGPAEMEEHIRYLSKNSPIPIAVLPNAGLPDIIDGVARYPLTPEEFGEWAEYFVRKMGVSIIGGCCGTTPAHIAAAYKRLSSKRSTINVPARSSARSRTDSASSLYSAISLDQRPRPFIVGERMNINGSKEFREHILSGNFDSAAGMSKEQAANGAHVLDLSVAYTGRSEISDMKEMASRLATVSPLPIMIDSTDPKVIEAALERLGGRSIINSINLEDGGKKAAKIIEIAKKHGAAIVGLTIDEDGMARTAKKKLSIAKRLIKLCKGETLFVDLLTFTLADPKAAEFGSGLETLKAIKALKKHSKTTRTLLGVSNISYGLRPNARKALNSVFLHESVKAGLDAAIVHPGQMIPMHKIDSELKKLALDLIHCRRKDALSRFVAAFEAEKGPEDKRSRARMSDEKLLGKKILDGDKEALSDIIGQLLKKKDASEIINGILMPAMKKVGELFGSGEMVLPFVLRSAETMRTAVDMLAPDMVSKRTEERGRMVIATVRGDVHDIGKNLVDIILSNNGYKVINLGVKQTIGSVIQAVDSEKANAIGLSGLLVQSCLIMKDDLAELSHRGYSLPVICGGAALTRRYVENDLQKVYKGKVYYAKDAFEGLRLMQEICG